MSRWAGIIATLVSLISLAFSGGSEKQPGNSAPPAGAHSTEVPIVMFSYGSRGSVTYDIYSYDLKWDEEAGEMVIDYSLNCGYLEHKLPATGEFIQSLNSITERHNLWKWNGFNESNSNVLDGYGFSMDIVFSDGTAITARGDNCFPAGYSEAIEEVNELFLGYLKENGIDPEGGF